MKIKHFSHRKQLLYCTVFHNQLGKFTIEFMLNSEYSWLLKLVPVYLTFYIFKCKILSFSFKCIMHSFYVWGLVNLPLEDRKKCLSEMLPLLRNYWVKRERERETPCGYRLNCRHWFVSNLQNKNYSKRVRETWVLKNAGY